MDMMHIAILNALVLLGNAVLCHELFRLSGRTVFRWLLLAWMLNLLNLAVLPLLKGLIPEGGFGAVIRLAASLPSSLALYMAFHSLQVARCRAVPSSGAILSGVLRRPLGRGVWRKLIRLTLFGSPKPAPSAGAAHGPSAGAVYAWIGVCLGGPLAALLIDGRGNTGTFLLAAIPSVLLAILTLSGMALSFAGMSTRGYLDIFGAAWPSFPSRYRLPISFDDKVLGERDRLRRRVEQQAATAKALVAGGLLGLGAIQTLGPLALATNYSTRATMLVYMIAIVLKILVGLGFLMTLTAAYEQAAGRAKTTSVAEVLGILAASIEHDIRRPLGNMLKTIVTLKEARMHDTTVQTLASELIQDVYNVNAAVDLILTMRGIEGDYQSNFRTWNVVELCNVARKRVAAYANPHRIALTVFPHDAVYNARCYREHVIQAIVNVLNNAVEAEITQGRGVPEPVRIICSKPIAGVVRVVVLDHAGGVPVALVPKVFLPFVSTKHAKGDNHGMGLFTASTIVRAHGGHVGLETDNELITKVTIDLPENGETAA